MLPIDLSMHVFFVLFSNKYMSIEDENNVYFNNSF